ncbi:hypothetical protein CALVIDRAFT_182549 [Calocera viscosa TUFC12733]|uniref:Uncharacterized protein n=1 Tax=Calocera viscosa (strain TUFC12733) TaxID=1330018 RepID=A0A167L1B8_CALVF|nr:hypothetical protein CALVIDRAFT_182549 [Calocera viscosa TUFC12733]
MSTLRHHLSFFRTPSAQTMGASSSKAARQTAQTAAKARPSWAGATADSIEAAARARPNTVGGASAIKDEFIKRDAQDPHLLEQLNRIGPVSVNPQNMPFQTAQSARMNRIYQTRQANEEASESIQKNRFSASTLADLLNERKMARSQAELAKIAEEFNVDVDVLNQLARHVNAPSVGPPRRKQITEEGDDATPQLQAYWTTAPIDDVPQAKR